MMSTRELQLALRRPLLDFLDGLVLVEQRVWSGKRFTREAGKPYVSDSLVPSTRAMIGDPTTRGLITATGLYVIQWYGLPNQGLELNDTVDAIVALYMPGTAFVMADGNAVQIRADVAPWAGELLPTGDGWVASTITVPYECVTLTELTTAAA